MNLSLKRKKKFEVPEVDLTPMIDCVMNLYIFLMCISAVTIIIGITIKVPPTTPPSMVEERIEENLEVYLYQDKIGKEHQILEEGIIKLNGRRVNLENFIELLRSEKKRVGKNFLIIKGQNKVHYGKIVKIMDWAQNKEIGIKSFSFAPPTETEKEEVKEEEY